MSVQYIFQDGTIIRPDEINKNFEDLASGLALDEKAVLAAKVGSGAAIEGKVLTADGAGGALWASCNGGGDGAGAVTLIPLPALTGSGQGTGTMTGNTTAYFGAIHILHQIAVNKITIRTDDPVSVASTLDLAIYSEDGQTKHIAVTTPSIAAGYTAYTTTLGSPVTLDPGVYYFAVVANGADCDLKFSVWYPDWMVRDINNGIASEPILAGIKTVTAGTLPATFDPVTDLTKEDGATCMLRLN